MHLRVPLTLPRARGSTTRSPSCSTSGRARPADGWERVVERHRARSARSTIGFVGKYVELVEAYKSLNEALVHGGIAQRLPRRASRHIDSEELEKRGADGVAGQTSTASWSRRASARAAPRARSRRSATRARRRCRSSASASACRSPCIEFARNVVRPRAAPTPPSSTRRRRYPVVDLMPEQRGRDRQGRHHAPRRLSRASSSRHARADAYGTTEISERHRHRYEVNNDFRDALERQRHGAVGARRRTAGWSR